MWTPKRVLLLIAGFGLFFTCFAVYSNYLGGIDGLTPLPDDYWPPSETTPLPPAVQAANLADVKLKQAFGESCQELQRPVKLDMRKKRMVLAVDEFNPTPDGRVELKPFSVAMFGQPRADAAFPEINTIRSNVAYLQFDQKINTISDIGKSKMIGAELQGNIQITNNRRTSQRDDDVALHTQGPMFYQENLHKIWTTAAVKLIDMQSKPEPTTVDAEGMDVFLTQAPPPGQNDKAGHKPKLEGGISGVERIVLQSAVTMHLWVDSRSGFLASGKDDAKPQAATSSAAANGATPAGPPPAAPEKAQVVITTAGPFCYEINQDRAIFDIPKRQSRYPENVQVTRLHEQGKLDQLFCDHLELQFRHKADPKADQAGPASPADHSESLEIESAHATGRQVTLTSDNEGLDALGVDLFYDAVKRRSILKGGPKMFAMKDGNEIYARELWLTSTDKKDTHEALAQGPGEIFMLDKSSGQRNLKARWRDLLEYKKEGPLDILILTGDAAFEDKEHAQSMQADRLKVWLEPAGAESKPAPSTAAAGDQQRLRPNRVEAKGHVKCDAPDLHIKEPTEDLVIWFKDAPLKTELPAPSPDKKDAKPAPPAPGLLASKPANPDKNPAQAAGNPAPAASGVTMGKLGSPEKPGTQEKPKKPIDLSARSVKVYVLRTGVKNELDHLWCEGTVHVHQEPASAEEKGVDIRGNTLDLTHSDDGSVLVVTGRLAHVQLDKITIDGPEVNIDQKANKAWVNGLGAMQMWNTTTFDGGKLAKPTPLTIYWKEHMLFNGKNAEFLGGIQAEQENSRLLCHELQVAFDRPISLKENDKGQPPAKVDKLLCDKDAQIEDVTRRDGKIQSYKRLVAPVVALDNAEKELNAPGPGEVRILQLTAQGEGYGKPPSPKGTAAHGSAKPAGSDTKQEPNLTHVRFRGRMQANNERRTAVFFDNVEVVHVPTDQADLKIDLDHPPPGCMYLHCQKLNVFTHQLPDGTKSQDMLAQHNVYVQTQEFYALAEVVKYDEEKEMVIFEGGQGGMATLYRVKAPGLPQEKLIGKKITYWRRTGLADVENGQGINVAQ